MPTLVQGLDRPRPFVGHSSPIASAMDSYTSLMFRDGRLADVLVPLAVLSGMTALFFAIGIRRFRYDL